MFTLDTYEMRSSLHLVRAQPLRVRPRAKAVSIIPRGLDPDDRFDQPHGSIRDSTEESISLARGGPL